MAGLDPPPGHAFTHPCPLLLRRRLRLRSRSPQLRRRHRRIRIRRANSDEAQLLPSAQKHRLEVVTQVLDQERTGGRRQCDEFKPKGSGRRGGEWGGSGFESRQWRPNKSWGILPFFQGCHIGSSQVFGSGFHSHRQEEEGEVKWRDAAENGSSQVFVETPPSSSS